LERLAVAGTLIVSAPVLTVNVVVVSQPVGVVHVGSDVLGAAAPDGTCGPCVAGAAGVAGIAPGCIGVLPTVADELPGAGADGVSPGADEALPAGRLPTGTDGLMIGAAGAPGCMGVEPGSAELAPGAAEVPADAVDPGTPDAVDPGTPDAVDPGRPDAAAMLLPARPRAAAERAAVMASLPPAVAKDVGCRINPHPETGESTRPRMSNIPVYVGPLPAPYVPFSAPFSGSKFSPSVRHYVLSVIAVP